MSAVSFDELVVASTGVPASDNPTALIDDVNERADRSACTQRHNLISHLRREHYVDSVAMNVLLVGPRSKDLTWKNSYVLAQIVL